MGYPYSDSNQHASGSRHEYEQSASGSGSGYKERRTSLESAQGGKKPITASRLGLDPVAKQERRREQNRIAQRAFRARAKIREQERVSFSLSPSSPPIRTVQEIANET
jgi:hypothetical protein